jgi:glycosyltransferase involved in cell wall biosynthesis
MRLLSLVKPDVLYVNTMTIPLWVLLGRLRGIPVICHVHEGESSAPRILRSALALPLFLAARVIANSRFSVGVLAASFPRLAARVIVVNNGVKGPPTVTPSPPHFEFPLRVTYVGRLSPRKGVDVAIQSIADLAARGVDSRLDIVGDVFVGYEWYEAQLRDQVASAGLSDRVVFHGFQPSIWPIVASGDVVVVPSRVDEPFGDTAVEAVLSGRRVIASATSGLLEATDGYQTAITVAPGNANALADALQQTIQTWEGTSSQIEADTERALARHGAHAYRRQIADLIDTMVIIAR